MDSAEETTPSTGKIIDYATRIIAMIREDITAGAVPAGVAQFEDLHDYVDANEYVLRLGDGLVDFGELFDEKMQVINAIEAAVAAMLPAYRNEADARDLVVEGWARAMIEELRSDARRGEIANPFATRLAEVIPSGFYAQVVAVQQVLPAPACVTVDSALVEEVLAAADARLPMFTALDAKQVTDLYEVVEIALQTPGFIDPRCEDERPGLESLFRVLGSVQAGPK